MIEKEVFLNYVEAFEDAYLSNDWSKLLPSFTTDVVHDTGLGEEVTGRDAVIDYLRESTEGFDRSFDSRTPTFGQVTVRENQVSSPWRFIYKKEGAPELVATGVEVAEISGQSISRLNSVFDEGVPERTQEWLERYGTLL